jgi:hypothetical protein
MLLACLGDILPGPGNWFIGFSSAGPFLARAVVIAGACGGLVSRPIVLVRGRVFLAW